MTKISSVLVYKIKRLIVVMARLLCLIDKKSARRKIIKLKGQYLSRRSYKKGLLLANNGIGISLDMAGANSLAQVGRDLIDKLEQTDIQFAVFDTKVSGEISQSKWKIASSYTKHISDLLPYKKKILCRGGECYKEPEYDNITTPFWEFESGMLEVFPNLFEDVHSVIAFSDFCYNYFKTIIPQNVKLYKVKYPFVKNWEISHKPEEVRKEYNLKTDDFVVYYAFDYNSCYERKNPEAVVMAFAQSFKNNPKAKLVIKTNGFVQNPNKVEKLKNFVIQQHIENQTVFVNSFLTRNQIMELMNACDVFISLHRGEGLGLGMLEAMALAKPVIATNFGGNTEFMNKENSFLVDYGYMRPQNLDYKTYAFVEKWADPNITQAADYLNWIYTHQQQVEELGKKAQQSVFEYFNIKDFIKEISKIIKDS